MITDIFIKNKSSQEKKRKSDMKNGTLCLIEETIYIYMLLVIYKSVIEHRIDNNTICILVYSGQGTLI